MTRYSKFNIVYLLQKWMDSVPGQTFLNYAYSWGASIVILGTLFKLTHLPGANLMLFIGMGTEVLVFFISAFDRPFDKTTDGMDLVTHYGQGGESMESPEKEQLEGENLGDEMVAHGGGGQTVVLGGGGQAAAFSSGEGGSGTVVAGGGGGGGTIIIGGGASGHGEGGAVAAASGENAGDIAGGEGGVVGGVAAVPTGIPGVSAAWLEQQQQVSPEMAEATENYVEELKNLTEVLTKANEQIAKLAHDSEEMENLNRTLTGITKVYEMQLKGASQQIGTIDQINEQSRKMAQQIEQLNKIYARMIEAMTINMRSASPTTPTELNP